jgi:WD40 repeat protein
MIEGAIPKITDFGLAKRLDEQGNSTISGEVVGTPSYMAPEQAAGRPRRVGPHTDVYALGAILYEMLTGQPPFKGATALDTVLQVLHEEPERPSRLRPEVPRDLETICLKCLEKTPSRRYPSALELADDLRRFRKGDPVHARPVGPQERFWKWARRRPTTAALAASVVLLSFLAFAAVTWQWRQTAAARDEAQQANTRARAAVYRITIAQSQLRWRLHDFPGARSSLDLWLARFKKRSSPEPEDPRSWEWGYLKGLYASELLTMEHPGGGPSGGLVVSPNGKRIASVITGQREVRIWSAEDGALLFTLPAAPRAQRLAFRPPNGDILAVADDSGTIALWDLTTRKHTDRRPHTETIAGLAFSPDGKWLATASWDGTVKVQDVATGKPRHPALTHDDKVNSVAFRPNGAWLATGDQLGLVRLYAANEVNSTTTTRKPLQTLSGHKSAVYGVAFSPSGQRLASAGSNGNVRVWDLDGWQRSGNKFRPPTVQSLTSKAGAAALGLAYSPDGRYLAYGCSDSTVRVWYLNAGALRVIFLGHTHAVEALRFSPDGRRLYSCCPEQGAIKVWDLTRPPEYSTLAQTRHPEYVRGGLLAKPNWPEVRVVDLLRETSGPNKAATGPDVEALAFQDEGRRLVSVTVGGKLQTWDTASGMLLDEKSLPLTAELFSPAVLADFSADGQRLAARRNEAGDKGQVVGLWSVEPAQLLRVLKGHRYPVFGVRFSHSGLHLATFACDRTKTGRPHEVKVWHAESGRLVGGWEGHGHLFSLAFSPDGRWLATGGEDGQVDVVEWANGKITPFRAHKKAVTALAFSRDGRWLATAGEGDRTVQIQDTKTWKELARAEAPGIQCDLAFSADGKRLAGISHDVVTLWDVQTGQELLTLRGAPQRHRDPPFNSRLAFSPDGHRLVGSNWDESISVWEAETISPERQHARRAAAERRAPLWHLQEAEQCLMHKFVDLFAARYHLKQIDCLVKKQSLPAPLQERLKRLQERLEGLESARKNRPGEE